MSGPQFFQTPMGKQFYDGTMPQIAKSSASIAKSLETIVASLNENTINGLVSAMNRLAAAQEEANAIARANLENK